MTKDVLRHVLRFFNENLKNIFLLLCYNSDGKGVK